MAALAIFAITFTGVALTRLPWVRVDRPVAAFLGAVAMVLFGVLTVPEAVSAIDWNTIALLLGMMVIIGGLQRDGYVEALATALLGRAKSGRQLLVVVVLFTGVASAFLVNDAVVLVVTPLVIAFCRAKGLNPLPFLLAEAMASNIGSTATITGNPQNVLIGLQSGLSFGRFMLFLLPVAALSIVLLIAVTQRLYRNELRKPFMAQPGGPAPGLAMPTRVKPSGVILILVVLGFLLGPWLEIELPLIALTGAGLVLASSGHGPREIFRQVDWVLLLFFAALFVVIGGAVQEGLFDWAIDGVAIRSDVAGGATLHGASLLLSQLISNVPFTVLMLPILQSQSSDFLWISLASGATLAGNLTLIGAVANLIVAEGALQQGVRISFWEFFKLGLPVTALTLLISLAVLSLEHVLGFLG